MRPQDIVILIDLLVNPNLSTQKKDIGYRLFISQSEVSESLHRSALAGLISDRNKVYVQSFTEFLEHGFRYVYPVEPGALSQGMETAHSHPFLRNTFASQLNYVWPDFHGDGFGASIEPLYPKQLEAARKNENLYKALALLDVLRVGRTREIAAALKELKLMFVHGQSQ